MIIYDIKTFYKRLNWLNVICSMLTLEAYSNLSYIKTMRNKNVNWLERGTCYFAFGKGSNLN